MRHLRISKPVLALTTAAIVVLSSGAFGRGTPLAGTNASLVLAKSAPPRADWLPAPGSSFVPPTAGSTLAGTLDGSWQVSAQGAFQYALALDVPDGRAGMAPSLTLSYSGSANGPLGVGFSLTGSMSAITRCGKSFATDGYVGGVNFVDYGSSPTSTGPVDTDRFCLDGQKLIATTGTYGANNTVYHTAEESFAEVRSFLSAASGAPDRFEVRRKDGRIATYLPIERSPGYRVMWVLRKLEDRVGNTIEYLYEQTVQADGAMEVTPSSIRYTSNSQPGAPTAIAMPARRIDFIYDATPRVDSEFAFESGVKWQRTKRLRALVMHAPNVTASGTQTQPVWKYDFEYVTRPTGFVGRALLASVQRCATDTSGTTIPGACSARKRFNWQTTATPTFTAESVATNITSFGSNALVMDVNGDGGDDVLTSSMLLTSMRPANGQLSPLIQQYGAPLADTPSVSLVTSRPMDFDGNGASELWALSRRLTANGYLCGQRLLGWNQLTGRFAFASGSPSVPEYACAASNPNTRPRFLDLDGNGRPDLVMAKDRLKPIGAQTDPETGLPWMVAGTWEAFLNNGTGLQSIGMTDMQAGCPTHVVDTDGDGLEELVSLRLQLADTSTPDRCVPNSTAMKLEKREGAPTINVTATSSATQPTSIRYSSDTVSLSYSYDVIWGDFNGDGLVDALNTYRNHLLTTGEQQFQSIQWNTGRGFTAKQTVSGIREANDVRLWDANLDGRMDLLLLTETQQASDPSPQYAKLYLSDGNGGFWEAVIPGGLEKGDKHGVNGYTTSLLGDFNADGLNDWLILKANGQSKLYRQSERFGDRLASVQDAANEPALKITYSHSWADRAEPYPYPACNYPTRCKRAGLAVVREVAVRMSDSTDPALKWNTFRYSYAWHRSDVTEGNLGFQYFWVWDPLRRTETKYEFNHTPYVRADKPGRRFYDRDPAVVTVKKPILSAAQLAQTTPISNALARITRTRTLSKELRLFHGGKTWALLPMESQQLEWEQSLGIDPNLTSPSNGSFERLYGTGAASNSALVPSDALVRRNIVMQHDDFGNVTFLESALQGGATTTLEATYKNFASSGWLIGLLETQTLTMQEADPTQIQQQSTKYYYTLPSGRLSAIEREPNATDPSLKQLTNLYYSPYGLLMSSAVRGWDANGVELPTRRQYLAYEPWAPGQLAEQVHVSQVWSSTPNGRVLSTWTAVDPAWGLPVATQNSLGVRGWTRYDLLGRPVWRDTDVSAPVLTSYAGRTDAAGGYSGLSITNTQLHANNSYMNATTIVTDGLGRTLKQTDRAFDGGLRNIAYSYDKYGRLQSVSRPYTGSPTHYQRFEYDSLGRVTATLDPDGSRTSLFHSYFVTTRIDPMGHQVRSVRDVNGRQAQSMEYLGKSDGSFETLITSYQYGPFGVLLARIDPQGNRSAWKYDRLGRMIEETLPDSGTSKVVYDSFGALRETQRLTGDKSIFAYDSLGRPLSRTELDASGAAQFQASFIWDTAANGLGQLAETTAINGLAPAADVIKTTYQYDALGRTERSATIVDGQSYVSTFGYDAEGRLISQTYPAVGSDPEQGSFKTCFGYNPLGYFNTVGSVAPGSPCVSPGAAGWQPLWAVQSRNLDGALLNGVYGNGMLALRTYDVASGRLDTLATFPTTIAPLPAPLQKLDYDYYANGLVQRIDDLADQREQEYGYDTLGRLIRWDLTRLGQVRRTGFEYDQLGNLLEMTLSTFSASQSTPPQGVPIKRNTYGLPGKPHAIVRHEDLRTATPRVYNYEYDDRGRQTVSKQNGQAVRTVAYLQGGLLPRTMTTAEGVWTFSYDAKGERIKKVGPTNKDGTTISIGAFERRSVGPALSHVLQLQGSDGPIAQVSFTDSNPVPQISYLLKDAQGSTTAVVNTINGTHYLQKQFYEPFGKRITSAGLDEWQGFGLPLNAVTRGFTDHRMEYYGPGQDLIDMRGRLYDPNTARFMSPDPVHAAGQRANRYSYVYNSPLNYTDPTGYRADDGSAGPTCSVPDGNFEGVCELVVGGDSSPALEEVFDIVVESGSSPVTSYPGGIDQPGYDAGDTGVDGGGRSFDDDPKDGDRGVSGAGGASGYAGSGGASTSGGSSSTTANPAGPEQLVGAATALKGAAKGLPSLADGQNIKGLDEILTDLAGLSKGAGPDSPEMFRLAKNVREPGKLLGKLGSVVDLVSPPILGDFVQSVVTECWGDGPCREEMDVQAWALINLTSDQIGEVDGMIVEAQAILDNLSPNDPSREALSEAIANAEAWSQDARGYVDSLQQWRKEHGPEPNILNYLPFAVTVGKYAAEKATGSDPLAQVPVAPLPEW